MPRPPRADEASGIYHALNRGNLRATIFHMEGDYVAFEKILGEGLERYQIELLCYQLMSNHYHLELRPLLDGELSRFMKWIGGTHTMRYHANYHTQGLEFAAIWLAQAVLLCELAVCYKRLANLPSPLDFCLN